MSLLDFFSDTSSLASPSNLKIATLFTGIGAAEFALKRLRLDHELLFACDIDKYVKDTYYANYNFNGRWFEDISKIQTSDLSEYIEKVDLLVGGSPCQSFSFVGDTEGFDDPRGMLFFEFIRVVGTLKPRVFIYENVQALRSNQDNWKVVKHAFEELGYHWKAKILNSKDFLIPQHRKRLFVVGFADDQDYDSFDFPSEEKLELKQFDLLIDSNSKNHFQGKEEINLADIYNLKADFFLRREYMVDTPPEKFFLSDKVKDYVLSFGTKNYRTVPKLDLEVARPLLSTMHKMHRAGVDNYFQDKYNGRVRKLTPRECLRLMGFDDRFKQVVSDTRIYMQAGNSIVVDVLIAILLQVEFIREKIETEINKDTPAEVIN